MIPYFHALFIQRHGMISALMIYGRFSLYLHRTLIMLTTCVASMRLMHTVFSDAVLFLGVKQMQFFKFNTLILQRLANSMSTVCLA